MASMNAEGMKASTSPETESVAAHTRIGHTSLYADDPFTAATTLATVLGGTVIAFPPQDGGFVCFLDAARTKWSDEFVEFYPRDVELSPQPGGTRPQFSAVPGGRSIGGGSHVNIVLDCTDEQIEEMCGRVDRPSGWRWAGVMDVWIEPRLMVELVPGGNMSGRHV